MQHMIYDVAEQSLAPHDTNNIKIWKTHLFKGMLWKISGWYHHSSSKGTQFKT